MLQSFPVKKIQISAEILVKNLLELSKKHQVSILDSCGVNYLNSHYLIAGIKPLETFYLHDENPQIILDFLDEKLSVENLFNIFTVSYDFGLKLQNIKIANEKSKTFYEPDMFLAVYDVLIVHDYDLGETFLRGNEKKFDEILTLINFPSAVELTIDQKEKSAVTSNLSKRQYLEAVEKIQEAIRCGDTYQTNLTRQFRALLAPTLTAEKIFWHLREQNPAPFAAFIKRENDAVVSTSPERFFKIENNEIETSPIKGTAKRGKTKTEDDFLKNELLNSSKDRAENTMIVDLLRNDLGRICKFGSVSVEKLCEIETHPNFFHLVSTVSGKLNNAAKFSDILRAVFPCGSITGAPKIKTMQIINEIETVNRGLSMGAVGYSFNNQADLSVAIRTMVIKNQEAVFNVGGGILIDSRSEDEYEEIMVKAKAIFDVINADTENLPQ